jgi:hypothetical protein
MTRASDRTVTLIVYVFAAMLALAMGLTSPLWAGDDGSAYRGLRLSPAAIKGAK